MPFSSRHFPEFLALLVILTALAAAVRWSWRRWSGRGARALILLAGGCWALWSITGFLVRSQRFSAHLPDGLDDWIRASSLSAGALLTGLVAIHPLARRVRAGAGPVDSGRRKLLRKAGAAALYSAPPLLLGYGFTERRRLSLREYDLRVPGLPQDLNGLRIVQLSDIHLGRFLERGELRHAVDLANEAKAHLAVVTGDIISDLGDPLEDGIEELARLRAEAGILGCHGNHEVYSETEGIATEEGAKRGIRFLRHERARLRFGRAVLNVAGVDYQSPRAPYLEGAGGLVEPGAVNVLLSHNPDVFPVAARQGFAVTLAGHTHGGQVNVEILRQHLNVARFFTPYTEGIYEREGAVAFVNRGIGTIGVPVRIGAPPEVALLRLCAI
jgi:predicted MPP superfamily phosphohydrolase